MKVLTLTLRVPSLQCDFCPALIEPPLASERLGDRPLNIFRVDDHFELTAWTYQDMEAAALARGWKQIRVYGKELAACPACQKKGPEPGFDDRMRRLNSLFRLRAILKAPTLDEKNQLARAALDEGEAQLGTDYIVAANREQRAADNHRAVFLALEALMDSATDGRECPEWLRERLADLKRASEGAQ